MRLSALCLLFVLSCSSSLDEPSLQSVSPDVRWYGTKTAPKPATQISNTQATENIIPKPKAGADLIGSKFPLDELVYTSKVNYEETKVYVIRWWTDTCPYCEATLPAIEALRTTYASQGLETIAVYHPKPPREVSYKKIESFAKEREYNGTLAVDLDWALLKKIWLNTKDRGATSVTFVVDAKGFVRFLHPGPEYHPSNEKSHAECNDDFLQMKQAIEVLLTE